MDHESLAAFDFDGTITRRDTLFHFLLTSFGSKRFYTALLYFLPRMLFMKAGIINSSKTKERLLGHFLTGFNSSEFDALCRDYALNHLPLIIRAKALEKIEWHINNGHIVTIVSASIYNWIEPWATSLKLATLSTKMEVRNGKLTGKFDGENCKGIEKVIQLKKHFPKINSYTVYAYGDSSGDDELLKFADSPHYRLFH